MHHVWPSNITQTSRKSSRSKKDKTISTMDEAIVSMVRTMNENQDLKKTVSDILNVEKNPEKSFI